MDPRDFEKLGAFYLGRVRADDGGPGGDDAPLLLYDSRDLTTHAVCVGMTGSGKTGLCIDLLEEAALDGVPSIAIDPKGDLGNLLLTFPELRPEDFRPWIEEEAASRRGLDPDAFAAAEAKTWREGLAAWGQDGDRIRRLKEAAEFTIYTPGSTAGVPLSIPRSLEAPPPAVREDPELLGDRIRTTVSSLLGRRWRPRVRREPNRPRTCRTRSGSLRAGSSRGTAGTRACSSRPAPARASG